MKKEQLIGAMAEAVGVYEGFYKKGSRSKRNNNPGNLRQWGKLPQEGPENNKMVVFPSVEAGWKALDTQVAKNIDRGLTLYEFFAGQRDEEGEVIPNGYPGFAPARDKNKPSEYAAFVASFIKKQYGWQLSRDKILKSQVQA